jgi:tetratricopeptide (TPR) repeat protein
VRQLLIDNLVFAKRPEPRTGHFALVLNNLGLVRRFQHRDTEATLLFERSVSLIEAELGSDHPSVLHPLVNLATIYAESQRSGDAELAFQRALTISQKHFGTENLSYGNVLHNYATFLRRAGRKSEARVLETRSKQVLRQAARCNGTGETIDVTSFAQN